MGTIDVTPILMIIAAATVAAAVIVYLKIVLERWACRKRRELREEKQHSDKRDGAT